MIRSPDGTTWTWHIVSDTVVRRNGAKTTASALSAGETVFAGGPVANGTRDARLIVIRPDGSSASPAPSGSPSPGTSLRYPAMQGRRARTGRAASGCPLHAAQ